MDLILTEMCDILSTFGSGRDITQLLSDRCNIILSNKNIYAKEIKIECCISSNQELNDNVIN